MIQLGTRVVLRESIYGYEMGCRGVVVRSRDLGGQVLVRFDDTGHSVFVASKVLRPEEAAD